MELKKKARLIIVGSILGGIFFTLFIDSAWAIDWNETSTLIESSGYPNADEKCVPSFLWNPEVDNWFIKYDDRIGRYDRDLVTRIQNFQSIQIDSNTIDRGDCVLALDRDTIECFGVQTTVGDTTSYLDIALDDFTSQTVLEDCGSLGTDVIEWIYYEKTDGTLIWMEETDDTIYYSLPYKYACPNRANGTIDVPDEYSDVRTPVILRGESSYHYLVFVSGISGYDSIYYAVYDAQYNYTNIHGQIENNATHNLTNPTIMRDPAHRTIITYHRNDSEHTVVIKSFAIDDEEDLDLLQTQTPELEPIENNASDYGNSTRDPSTIQYQYNRTIGESRLWLFYRVFNSTAGSKGVYGLAENITCTVGDWTNVSECVGDFRKQVRWVFPSGCEDTVNWIRDEVCELAGGEIHDYQQTYREKIDGICYSDWVNPKDVSNVECYASVEIPEDCTEIIANATLTTEVEQHFSMWGSLETSRYSLMVCNPLENANCFQESPLCESQSNRSQTQTYRNYNAGDTATAKFEVAEASVCYGVRSWLVNYGWNRYRVRGVLSVSCNKYCGGWKCERIGSVDYTVFQFPDCSFNLTTRSRCEEGCINGECQSTDLSQETIRSPSGNMFDWVKGEVEFLMPSWVLMVLAVGLTLSGGLGVYLQSESWEMGFVSIIGLSAIFLSIGWIPAIYGILWIITVVLLLAQKYAGFVEREK